jgi:hypothetical protein
MSGKNPLPRELGYEGVKAINPPDIITSVRAPTVNDKKYPIGTMWMDTTTQDSYQLVASPGVWALLGGAAGGDLQTLTTSDATVVDPHLGNITIAQGTNILTTGAGSTVTISVVGTPTFDALNVTGDVEVDGGIASVNGSLVADNGSVTADINVTANTGDVTATAGNIVATAGDFILAGALANLELQGVGSQIQIKGGDVTDTIGTLTLVAGTATVLNTHIAANDRIFISRISNATNAGNLTYAITPTTSFVVTSTNNADTGTFAYLIVRQL